MDILIYSSSSIGNQFSLKMATTIDLSLFFLKRKSFNLTQNLYLRIMISSFGIKRHVSPSFHFIGDKFNVKDFHHQILKLGPIGLDILEEIINDWIASVTPLVAPNPNPILSPHTSSAAGQTTASCLFHISLFLSLVGHLLCRRLWRLSLLCIGLIFLYWMLLLFILEYVNVGMHSFQTLFIF